MYFNFFYPSFTWKQEGIFLWSSPWDPGRAAKGKIHDSVAILLRLAPQELLSFQLHA